VTLKRIPDKYSASTCPALSEIVDRSLYRKPGWSGQIPDTWAVRIGAYETLLTFIRELVTWRSSQRAAAIDMIDCVTRLSRR